ncbi:hypothetical protein DEA8626_03168 [Defluviimonas aquaemixtae]|uniref:Transglycosylase associated protein n=1 Tax=Albidovulum aquaemixtae TaxID=1542388 RepID=A0A2R8BL61_9RHOB|nr:GlsB/YeaQ/YmgE family stress response membrane protein [Defluviimonas aquaemixtae]SPH24119.1 hypothetical protein DEA8626_03168 [Defluviimonas aquaemixtae]
MGIGFFGAIIVGGLAGWIASMIMKADTGVFANVGLGILGAVLLNGLLRLLSIYPAEAWIPQLVVGIVGASLLIWIWRRMRG